MAVPDGVARKLDDACLRAEKAEVLKSCSLAPNTIVICEFQVAKLRNDGTHKCVDSGRDERAKSRMAGLI